MNNKFISIMTNRIVRDFDPLQIILFGSQARGDTDRDSDIDLLVVFSELTDKRKTAIDIGRTLATDDLNILWNLVPDSWQLKTVQSDLMNLTG